MDDYYSKEESRQRTRARVRRGKKEEDFLFFKKDIGKEIFVSDRSVEISLLTMMLK